MEAASFWAQYDFVIRAFVAGILASFACGLGAVPLAFPGLGLEKRVGLGYAFACGLMFSASVYNLLLPAFTLGNEEASGLGPVLRVLAGMGLGAGFLALVEKSLTPERMGSRWLSGVGGRTEVLVFLAMTLHSVPEGVAVGVGYGAETHLEGVEGFGNYIALAIALHNIPEGLAVALPLRLKGASLLKCAFLAFLTSLPQPIAAVPAGLLVWISEPLMLPFLGFAAGAMIYLILMELLPEALEKHSRHQVAWMFLLGFGAMALVQVGL
jgi:ZIP family zinc transporter